MRTIRTEIRPVADLTDTERAALRSLSEAVYPSEVAAAWPGRSLEWASHGWCVVTWAGGDALCYVGVVVRDARCDGRVVRVGGIGGVKTHPAAQGRGFATAAVRWALDFLRGEGGVDFALLVCEPSLIPFYERLGWRWFPGVLLVTQHWATVPFTFNPAMTIPVRRSESPDGTINLMGPPW